ncbi:MAG TPA: response regulator transcription factor [Vicinamibacterales bacterium]|nr:response regulator transcription factor [Vicinamibacterales bacterium]
MSRVLIVEDDADIAGLLRHTLQKGDHEIDMLSSGSAVLPHVAAHAPDLIVLDLMLPGMDGLHVCQALRRDPVTASIPILMLTAKADEDDRVRGLELGADDYVTKPFSPKEVAARVDALLRRVTRTEAAPVLRYGPLFIDADRHAVEFDGAPVRLTAKEFLLLQYLLQRPGRVLSRDRLLTDVWGYQYTGGTRTVDVHVRRLREKLPYLERAIVTIKQFGYKLADTPPPRV